MCCIDRLKPQSFLDLLPSCLVVFFQRRSKILGKCSSASDHSAAPISVVPSSDVPSGNVIQDAFSVSVIATLIPLTSRFAANYADISGYPDTLKCPIRTIHGSGRTRTWQLQENGGPTRTRTWDQGIHCTQSFLIGADYLISLDRIVRGRDALACY